MNKPRYSDMKTKQERVELVKRKLGSDTRWAARGLLTLYTQQTAVEQHKGVSKHDNGVGFNGTDAGILTSISQLLLRKGAREDAHDLSRQFSLLNYLSDKQTAVVLKVMPKYAAQLVMLSEELTDFG